MCFKGGTTSAPSARGLGILAFPESPRALGAEARGDSTKNRTPSEIEEVVGLERVRRTSGHNKILHPQPPATEDPQDSGALDAYCEP